MAGYNEEFQNNEGPKPQPKPGLFTRIYNAIANFLDELTGAKAQRENAAIQEAKNKHKENTKDVLNKIPEAAAEKAAEAEKATAKEAAKKAAADGQAMHDLFDENKAQEWAQKKAAAEKAAEAEKAAIQEAEKEFTSQAKSIFNETREKENDAVKAELAETDPWSVTTQKPNEKLTQDLLEKAAAEKAANASARADELKKSQEGSKGKNQKSAIKTKQLLEDIKSDKNPLGAFTETSSTVKTTSKETTPGKHVQEIKTTQQNPMAKIRGGNGRQGR
ncbi:MAG: hypothetical protein P8P83_03140 [Rickettsiaceae bacterium]|nr:hypothetical protein [Rickettsiaceae bacterium]